MAARHARIRMFSSPAGIAATAAVAVAVAVGGTVGAARLTSSEPAEARRGTAATSAPTSTAPGTPSAAPSPTGSPSPSATASPAAARSTAASRSRPRAASTPTKRATPKPTATRKTSAAPKVVDSGTCGASFYAEGQLTANGENFDPQAMTAAHKTLPFGTRVRVTNPGTGAAVTVRINDRGPYIDGRCIDLSRAAFRAIASLDLGHLTVRYEVLG